MKVAVSTDSGQVSAHFGHCPEITVAEVSDGRVSSKKVVRNPAGQPCALPAFLATDGVEAIICGRMGEHAQKLFAQKGIDVWMGAAGPVDNVLADFAQGRLQRGVSCCDHDEQGHGHQCRRCS